MTIPPRQISRRDLLAGAAATAALGAIGPFTFVRTASAATLDQFIRERMRSANTPSVSVAVVRGNHIAFSSAAGWADREREIRATPQTAYMLASVSKTVTCAGIMSLWQEGRLDLDADVNDVLPFEVRIPKAPAAPITMRMLLTHTSSIRDRYSLWGTPASDPTLYFHGDAPIPLGEFERSYLVPGGDEYRRRPNFFERPPGRRYAYSNVAVALAGYVAEVVSGVDFDRLCRSRILEPLGMTSSGFRLADVTSGDIAMPYRTLPAGRGFEPYYQYGYPDYPDGGLRTSAVHLARWLGAFMNGGSFGGVRVLRRDTVAEIRRNQIPGVVTWHQGLIWYGERARGRYLVGHNGGDYGMSTRMFFNPGSGVGVVSLTNASLEGHRWRAFSDIEDRLFDEMS